MDTNTKQIVEKIKKLPHVTDARLWEGFGKCRIYIDTEKWNGGKNWNNGLGYWGMYIDVDAGTLSLGSEAGAKTRKKLAETVEKIKELALLLR
jgi:hypothetical protein